MGGYIPDSIKTKVIYSWIDGISRDDIGSQNEIATGTVSNIIRQDGKNIVDIDILRALSKQLKKDGVTTRDFTSGVRLANRLKRLGMSVEDMDSLVELMDVHCFKTGQTVIELISKVEEASKIASNMGVSLDDLSEYICKQLDRKNGIESQIAALNKKLFEEFKKYEYTKSDLDEYRKNRHKIYEIRYLEDKLKKRDEQIKELQYDMHRRSKIEELLDSGMRKCAEEEIDKFNKNFNREKPLDIEELDYIRSELRYNPCEYPQIIKLMRDKLKPTEQKDKVV